MLPAEPVEHGREHAHNNGIGGDDPDLAHRRIGQELDVLYRLAQVVEHSGSAFQQGATVLRRFGTVTAAIEQPHADRVF
jgi:hypothetical protein